MNAFLTDAATSTSKAPPVTSPQISDITVANAQSLLKSGYFLSHIYTSYMEATEHAATEKLEPSTVVAATTPAQSGDIPTSDEPCPLSKDETMTGNEKDVHGEVEVEGGHTASASAVEAVQ